MSTDKKRIDNVVMGLARAAYQDFSQRVPVDEAIDDDFLQVEMGVNLLLEDLSLSRKTNEDQLKEIEEKNRELAESQSRALRELSTPIISVWDRVLCLPVVGIVDTGRSADMMETLLDRVVTEQAAFVIVDITGVTVLDTRTADHFLRMAKAIRLLGADCVLAGISPAVAQTMTTLGIDTTAVRTVRRLSDGLQMAFKELGITVSQ